MKYLVVLCDGMADTPVAALNGKTPMEAAVKPNMDALAAQALVGTAKTVPDGMKPGSDVANLSALGYRPAECYTGRSPLEAASIGIDLSPEQYAIRCNFVTLSDEENYAEKRMVDYCGGDISTAEAAELVKCLNEHLPPEMKLYTGVSYRHCLVWDNPCPDLGNLTPPHDISGKVIGEYLPQSPEAAPLLECMKASFAVLQNHPVNQRRIREGKKPANSAWFWGQGRKAALESFSEKFGVKGAVISAVDLIKGIGVLSGMEVIEVDGATGYIDTNFEGKAAAAIDAFRRGIDLVYVHVEAPDECGHRGEAENKVRAIEWIDQKIIGPVIDYLRQTGDFRAMVLPDHPTPLAIMTHTADPVPYLLYDSRFPEEGTPSFTESTARANGNYFADASALMKILIKK
ncbi:MAG: cofactor-independent phosphoglycerate mutase [Candidatus Merdivicinus sp.]|jgi:2,3-bisphosphoglycerate-independent phosphoglycerate mutase